VGNKNIFIITIVLLSLALFMILILLLSFMYRYKNKKITLLKHEYFKIESLPFNSKIKEISRLSELSPEIKDKFTSWKKKYDYVIENKKAILDYNYENLRKISKKNNKILKFYFNYIKTMKLCKNTFIELQNLFTDIEKFTDEKTKIRINLSELSLKLDNIKMIYEQNYFNLKIINTKLKQLLVSIENIFADVEDFLKNSNYEMASIGCKRIRESLEILSNIINNIPIIITSIDNIIPRQLDYLHDKCTNSNNIQYVNSKNFEFLRIMAIKNCQIIRKHCMNLQYKKAYSLFKSLEISIEEFYNNLKFEEEASEIISSKKHFLISAFEDAKKNNEILKNELLRKRKDIIIGKDLEKELSEYNDYWQKLQKKYAILILEINNKNRKISALEIIKGINYLSRCLLTEMEHISRKKIIILDLIRNKTELKHDLNDIKKWLFDARNKFNDKFMTKILLEKKLFIFKIETNIAFVENQLNKVRVNSSITNEKIQESIKIIISLSNEYKDIISSKIQAEKYIKIANRYISTNKSYIRIINDAEIAYKNKEYKTALSLASKILKQENIV